jgi:hypothetical protein
MSSKQKLLGALGELANQLYYGQISSEAGALELERLIGEFEELGLGSSSENVLNAEHVSGSVLQHHAGQTPSDPYKLPRDIIAQLKANTLSRKEAGEKLGAVIGTLTALTATPTHSNRINGGHVSGTVIQIGGGTVDLSNFKW